MTVRHRGQRVPAWMLVPAVLATLFLIGPPLTLLVRTPWERAVELLETPAVRDSIVLSLVTATIATGISLLVGIPLAWLMGNKTFRGANVLRTLISIPMVLPPVVGGAALLFTFGRNAPLGQWLSGLGISLPFTTVAVVMAQAFVAMPFLVVSLDGAFGSRLNNLEEAATTLGAGPWTTFRRVTLPSVAPALISGTALCWTRAIGEFGATITFAGSVRGVTQTLPLAVSELLGYDIGGAMMVSSIMIVISTAVLLLLRGRWFRGH